MNERDRIMEAVRNAVGKKEVRAKLPEYTEDDIVSQSRVGDASWERFAGNLEAVNGDFLPDGPALKVLLERERAKIGYCPPDLRPFVEPWLPEGVSLEDSMDRTRIDDYDFGVTRGSFAVVETGTLILKDTETPDRLGALAPWTHIAVVDRDKLLPSVTEAVRRLDTDPNVIWVTGPSKTADVEGILIEGVHGPGVQACLVVDP